MFIIAGLVAIFFATAGFFIALVVAVIFHELAHSLFAKHFGINPSCIVLTPFGGVLKLKSKILSKQQKICIYIAGPLGSLFLSILFGIIVWLFPIIFIYLEYLVVANFLIGIINLLPIYPLDGGKILSQFISSKVVLILSNILFVGVLLFSIVVFNWWWIAFAIMMLIQINLEYKQTLYFDKFVYKTKVGKFVRCSVLSSTTLWEAYRLVDRKQPTEFIVADYNNYVFYENDLEEWLSKNEISTEITRCLK
ncbi:MAG: site-2 protease family protein [Clostridia bacterium]|nr:site-2 protease family protein [Clostridia bacterium]